MPLNTLADTIQSRPRARSSLLSNFLQKVGLLRPVSRLPEDSVAFTSAFVALGAKMAMADGVAVKAEAQAFEKFLEVAPGQEPNIRRLYELASKDTLGFEFYAARINDLLAAYPHIKRDVLECLLYIACADGILHPAEDRFLTEVAQIFGYDEAEFDSIRALFVHDTRSPYFVLGINPASTDRQIKVQYRKLVSEHHPDRLIAAGAPPACIKAATAKLAAITSAYHGIVKERASRKAAS